MQRITRIDKKYSIPHILQHTVFKTNKEQKEIDGHKVNISSIRLQLFALKGCKCANCGIEGKYFIKEKFQNDISFHFELYAVNKDNEEIKMTKDHILPKCLGGSDKLENLQPMCEKCNQEKNYNFKQRVNFYTKEKIVNNKIDEFLIQAVKLMKRHNISIAYDKESNNFIIENFNKENIEKLSKAYSGIL